MLENEFKAVIIKVLSVLEKSVQDLSETFNKEIEDIKKEPVRNEELRT